MNAYYTHQQYLQKELDTLSNKSLVLELGIGDGSCPLMYQFCKSNPDSIVSSFETDSEWFYKMFEKYGDLPNYVFNLLESWDDLTNHVSEEKYNLVFVDQSPWQARIDSINLLKDKVDTFILHDYDYFNKDDFSSSKETCNSIYVNDETSWLGKTYSGEFTLEDNYQLLPPTLVMRKK